MPTKEINIEQSKIKMDLKSLLDEKDRLLNLKENINKQTITLLHKEASLSNEKERAHLVLDKIIVLKDVMKTTFGSSSFLGGEVSNPIRMFDDNDLIEYKAKMLELIKQL